MNKPDLKEFFSSLVYTLFSFALILVLWTATSVTINSELIMPSPKSVLFSLLKLLKSKLFYAQLGMTTLRSIEAFAIAFVISIILGFAIGISSKAEKFLNLPLGIVKVAPVVSFILPAIFWFSTDTVPVFVSVLMILPLMTANISHGIKSINSNFLNLSKTFNMSKFQKFKYIYINSIKSYLMSGATSAFSMSWKVVVASEVLCLPHLAAGTSLYSAKVHLDTAQVFAVSISVIVLSFILERIFYHAIHFASKMTGGYKDGKSDD